MPLRRALLVCLLYALLCATAAAQSGTGRSLGESTIPESAYLKFPRVAAGPEGVHVANNAGRLYANVVTRVAQNDAFGAVERLGTAEGQPDYSTASMAVAPDGRLVYVWINQAQRSVLARVRAPGGQWGPTRTVRTGEPFPVSVAVAASSTELFAVWRNPDRPMVFSRSRDGGATWSAPTSIGVKPGVNAPAIAAGADGTVAVAYTRSSGDNLQVFAGIWNGRGFDVVPVSTAGADFADPGVAVLSDGRVVVSYRGVAESGPHAGVFYAERAANGGWPTARLIGGKVTGPVSVAADRDGGMGLFWIGATTGRSQIWFAHLPRGGTWSAPAGGTAVGDGTIFNVSGALADGDDGLRYGHAASEFFVGDRTYGRAYRFAAGLASAGPVVSARPVIEGDAPHTRTDLLSVAFRDVTGAPTELRWRWGTPPSDADAWQSFAAEISLKAPRAGTACETHTLFTQVRSAEMRQSRVASDTIAIDRAVQATLTPVATTGAPGYTNVLSALLAVDGGADCSGLAQVRSMAADTVVAVHEPRFNLDVPVAAVEGPQSVGVELIDTLGNSATLSATVIYDATPPTLEPGAALSVNADQQASVLHTLQLEGARYTDASGELPWALAVALMGPTTPAGTPPQWRVYPIEMGAAQPADDGSVALYVELSLADLLPRTQLTPGIYSYEVRVVDRAGNLGATTVMGELTLDRITFPWVALPLVRR